MWWVMGLVIARNASQTKVLSQVISRMSPETPKTSLKRIAVTTCETHLENNIRGALDKAVRLREQAP
eukprot:1506918-Amphidinium_carterae.1